LGGGVVKNPLSTRLISNNLKIKIYSTIVVSLAYIDVILDFILTEWHRLRVFESSAEGNIWSYDLLEDIEYDTVRTFICYYYDQIKEREMGKDLTHMG
jgi:hypothetical protein